ncbi:hypothetical protein KKB68_00130 [Patescibacteria group bacterium]|nr:hypothetical protein [Patescibacteria group bacterium]
MIRKPDSHNKATALRHEGFSYNEILEHVRVGKGTISRWCHGIPLTEEQKERLIEKKRNTPLIRSLRRQATQSKKEAKVWAKKQINKLSNKDTEQLLLVSGILLYWAEGTRSNLNASVGFTNVDSRMIKMMMKFFREILHIPNDKFRIIMRISGKGDVKRAENYWSRITKVPYKNFRKPEILELTKNSKSINKYPYGMCRIAVYDVLAWRKVIALIESFLKNFAPVAQLD